MTQEQAKSTNPTKSATTKKKTKSPKRQWTRTTRILLTYVGIPVLFLVFLYVGLYIGYVRLGDQPAGDIWRLETWRHMYDLVFADR